MLQVFPFPLTRTATGPFAGFEPLRWAQLPALLAGRAAVLARRHQLRRALDEALYQYISSLSAPGLQRELVRLKRDIFNNRPLTPAQLAGLYELPAPLAADVQRYAATHRQLTDWEQDFEQSYQQQVVRSRAQVQQLARQPALLQGLLLSSRVLLAQLPGYWRTAPAEFRKKEHQTEMGLLRYLTRLHFKTSPFSAFTAVGVATMGQVATLIARPADEQACHSAIRLNNQLLAHLKTLLLLVPGLQQEFPVRWNPSAQVRDGAVHFLLNHHNVEAFQRLPAGEALLLVEQVLAAHGGQLPLARLLALLTQDHLDAAPAALLPWLLKLVECGLLEFNVDASGTDPDWDQALSRQLEPLVAAFPLAGEVRELLGNLRALAATYARCPATERSALLDQAHGWFRQTNARLLAAIGLSAAALDANAAYQQQYVQQYLTAQAFTVKPYLKADFQLYYEDAATSAPVCLDAAALHAYTAALGDLLAGIRQDTAAGSEQQHMKSYFLARYPPHAAVGLLAFYQDYFTDVRKPAQEQAAVSVQATPAAGPLSAWQTRLHNWLGAAYTAYPGTITIPLAQVLPPAGTSYSPRPAPPLAAFVQFFTEPAADGTLVLKGVVNRLSTGGGKNSGRFLHLFDEPVTQAFRSWNRQGAAADILAAELTDASYSNANLHPPLLPYQLLLPGSHAHLPPSVHLPVAELTVRYCVTEQRLFLHHPPSGRRVLPYDVGLQALPTRSELYQLLATFGPAAAGPSLGPLLEVVGQFCRARFPGQVQPLPGVFYYPRIQLEAGVVLQRRRWYVQRASFPSQSKTETDGAYLCRLTEWRQPLGVPAEVFLYLHPPTNLGGPGRPAGPDDYKPQYLHLESPLLVQLLSKQLPKAGDLLLLEEMYPATDALRQQGVQHVQEILIEWQLLPRSAPVAAP
jgi:lantibiotic biosynthesis protein